MLEYQVTNKQTVIIDSLMQILGYQVTYKQTDHDCNKGTTHSDTVRFPSVATMALRRNVLQEDDILCELYADTRSDVCDSSDNESLDSE